MNGRRWGRLAALAVLAVAGAGARAQAPGTRADRPGAVTRVSRDLAEFRLGRDDGVHPGARLVVVRPTAGDVVVDEVVVTIADDRQAVGKCQRRGTRPGDVVLAPRGDRPLGTGPDGLKGLYAEITLVNPPPGERRTTFNARIERVSMLGLVDVRDVEAVLLTDARRRSRMTIPAAAIKQLTVNGHVFVVDAPKRTLVTAEVFDYRQHLRAEDARRERIQLAEIASAERVRVAETRARIEADSRERVRLADLASRERVELERLQTERARLVARTAEDERRRAEAVVALARAEAAGAAGNATAPPYPTSAPSPSPGPSYVSNDTWDTAGKIYSLVRSVNIAYKGLRPYDSTPHYKADDVSQGLDAVDGVLGFLRAVSDLGR